MTRWKATKALSSDEEQLLEELWRNSERMEQRINALERILDAEVTDWRKQLCCALPPIVATPATRPTTQPAARRRRARRRGGRSAARRVGTERVRRGTSRW